MDREFALRTHLINLIFGAELHDVSFPAVPKKIGQLLVAYPHRVGIQEYQQN
jgi:hypothetical protein